MNIDEIRHYLESCRQDAEHEAKEFKDSYIVLDRLRALYSRLDPVDRKLADQVFAEWLESDNDGLRFDALFMIDEFKIVSAMSSLQTLATRLTTSDKPGAPFELKKVQMFIRDLGRTVRKSKGQTR